METSKITVKLHMMFDKYNIHYVINNIKYNPRNDYEKSILNLKIGYANILDLCEKNSCKLVNIQREITHNSIYLDHKLEGFESSYSLCYIQLQNEMTDDVAQWISTKCIYYRDYIYDTYIDYSSDVIQKLVYMEKIKTTPFYPNTYAWFCKTNNIIDNIFKHLNDSNQSSTTYISQEHLNIKLDIKPLIESIMRKSQKFEKKSNFILNKDIVEHLHIFINNK